MNTHQSLIIFRGLPGSGKTTLVHLLNPLEEWPVFSVDDFFTNAETGEYHFEFDKNHLAYKQCVDKTEAAMKQKKAKIFLHNTFTMEWELEPYFKLAKEFGYRVFVCTVENFHGNTNTHGVLEEQIQKMASKYKVQLF